MTVPQWIRALFEGLIQMSIDRTAAKISQVAGVDQTLDRTLLCATSVFSVSPWLINSEQKYTTETQRLHRGSWSCDSLKPVRT